MREPIETINYNGYQISIFQDEDTESPRDWDNLGTIVGWHRRYHIGDEQPKCTPEEFLQGLARDADSSIEGFEDKWDRVHRQAWGRHNEKSLRAKADAFLVKKRNAALDDNYVLLPVHMYEHGGVALSTSGFSCPWDSGQVGYIYVSKEKVVKEYGEWTADSVAKATKLLEGEIETYSQFINGEVYGYVIEHGDDSDAEEEGSCWGFYGTDDCIQEAKSQVDYLVKQNAALALADASCGNGI